MPIYSYKCSSCGFAKDVLQKISADPLHVCPSCGQDSFVKQVTAAGFRLKGSGWYVTDFRDQGGAAGGSTSTDAGNGAGAGSDAPAPASDPAPAAKTSESKPSSGSGASSAGS